MLNKRAKFLFRSHLPTKTLIPFYQWDSEPVFRDTWLEYSSTTRQNYAIANATREIEWRGNS